MVRRLREGVWLLELGLVPPLASNAFLVDETELGDPDGDVTLVDTGLRWNEPTLRAEFGGLGYGPADLDRVLLTHYDLDHVGGLDYLVPEFDGPVYVGAADLDLLDGTTSPDVRHHKGLFHRVTRRLFPLPDLDLRPVADGDAIGGFTAYHTPGHNPGHVVYYHSGVSAVFLGDLVWGEPGGLSTPIRFDSYDVAELRASVVALAERVPGFDVAAMGHGEPITSDGDGALAALAARC